MDKAKQILEEALSYKNCDGLIEENSRLEDAVLYAINQALRQPPVSGSVCEHLHQKWEGEYPHNCKKVCQVCREVLAN